MKVLVGLLALPILLSFTSCSSRKQTVAVGMTYDQVESILGKPAEITRGVNHVEEPNEDNYQFHVETTGQLIYVTWQYSGRRVARVHGKPFYEVKCVTFDASSGRVVMSGYQPIGRADEQ